MAAHQLLLQIVELASFIIATSASSGAPAQLTPSTQTYGPDGPWQGVSVSIGSEDSSVDLFPGGTGASTLLTSKTCNKGLPCAEGGIFNKNLSTTYNTSLSAQTVSGDYGIGTLFYSSATWEQGNDDIQLYSPGEVSAGLTVQHLAMNLISNTNITIGNGIPYPVQAGQLSLAPLLANEGNNDSATTNPWGKNATVIPENLVTQEQIPSNSFGLHYGSVFLKQALSCWLGGYDQYRVVGPVSTHPVNSRVTDELLIDLLDIGIGVETGGSPFSFPSKQGLLASNNASVGTSISVAMDPYIPFLNLPRSTCNAIAATLPVTYNASLDLNIWNTSSPAYKSIVTSPAYLSFTFPASAANNANITIKVPFALLNLTLEPPLVAEPLQYFPCQPPSPFDGTYSLGRSFLQAAFIGANWDKNEWYLAQAPGPNIQKQTDPVAMSGDNVVNGSGATWASTWTQNWTPLAANGAAAASSTGSSVLPPPSSGGLSGGAIAGIVVGALAGLALIFGAAIFFFLRQRRRRQRQSSGAFNNNNNNKNGPYSDYHDGTETATTAVSPFLSSGPGSHPEFKIELGEDEMHEMDGIAEEKGPTELGDTSNQREKGDVELEGTTDAGNSPRLGLPDSTVGSPGSGASRPVSAM